jgi:methanogenic corrinoid protein MtbC1
MANKKQMPSNVISNCQVTNTTAAANEHTRAAVESLAKAAEANANAIAEIAKALRGGNATIGNAFQFGIE